MRLILFLLLAAHAHATTYDCRCTQAKCDSHTETALGPTVALITDTIEEAKDKCKTTSRPAAVAVCLDEHADSRSAACNQCGCEARKDNPCGETADSITVTAMCGNKCRKYESVIVGSKEANCVAMLGLYRCEGICGTLPVFWCGYRRFTDQASLLAARKEIDKSLDDFLVAHALCQYARPKPPASADKPAPKAGPREH